ncbi:ATP-binding protein [Acidobacteria bacterium AB60]|nr:ATP-binding protein [Acidobacteria bacterium AB60]
MAITYTAPSEPLAGPPGGETAATPPVIAATLARRRLLDIIERYCRRQIAGRSVLIAGHRGAGKTTLVKSAIEELRGRQHLGQAAIPLYVQIHGPDLLGGETVLGPQGDSAQSAAKPADGSPGTASGPNPTPAAGPAPADGTTKQKDRDEIDQALTSLRVLTIALHRAFVTDLGWSFERGVSPQQLEEARRPHKRRSDDLQELAAQLRLDFDDLVETDGLRWMWDRAGFLDQGVLRRDVSAEETGTRYFSKQGLLEIVAASCVSDSYARSVAKIDDADKFKAEAEVRQTHEIEKLAEKKELMNAVAGILAGGVAGGGAALAKNGPLAGLLFVVSAVVTTLLLNYTSVRSRSRTRSREKNIQWDRSVASLDLMLPLSIARVLDAGRAPVFVIDELDKVNEIEEKLERLINRLKHIVADRALFCFLVDRTYFERIQTISRVEPQRKEHTFFSERLYVIATPGQWRAYLQTILKAGTTPEDRLDLLALTYVLLARSKMHAIDLRREIEALPRNETSPSLLDLPDLRGPDLYRNLIYMQAVVEFVLEEDAVKRRLQRDPNFAQSMHDALYYLLRQWEQDKPPEVRPEKVEAYLQARMGTNESRRRVAQEGDGKGEAAGEEDDADRASLLSEVDFSGLFNSVLQAANLLSDHESFKTSIQDKVAKKTFGSEWTAVVDMIPAHPLLQKVGEEWHWKYDINANAVEVPEPEAVVGAAPAVLKPAAVQQDPVADTLNVIQEVEQVDAAIRFYTNDRLTLESLGSELRLLPVAPTYATFQACASQYRANAGAGPVEQTYASLTSDKSMIQEYAGLVRGSLAAMKRTILLGEFLSCERHRVRTDGPDQAGAPGSRLRSDMLRFVARNLDFARLRTPQIDAMLVEFDREFEKDESLVAAAFRLVHDRPAPLDRAWIQQFPLGINHAYQKVLPLILREAGDEDWVNAYFRGRANAMILHLRNRQPLRRLSLRDLRVLVTARLPSGFDVPAIHGDPESMPLLDYAEALSAARLYPTDAAFTLTAALLIKLGFGPQIEPLLFQNSTALRNEDVSDLFEAARGRFVPGQRVMVVLGGSPDTRVVLGENDFVSTRKGEGSHAGTWTVSQTNAVYPVHTTDIASIRIAQIPNAPPIVDSLAFTLEIHDEDVPPTSLWPVQIILLGIPPVGTPATLDDAVAMAKPNVA